MGWWNNTNPKGFHHTYIYIDERNEAVRRSRQHRGEKTEEGDSSGKITVTPHAPLFSASEHRRMAQRSSMHMLGAVVVPLLMLFLIYIICMLLF